MKSHKEENPRSWSRGKKPKKWGERKLTHGNVFIKTAGLSSRIAPKGNGVVWKRRGAKHGVGKENDQTHLK